ncbi:MAG: X-Pro aminopeptidase [Sulfurovum sp. FS08-3]|nr:MAG: X-Pro aminopeptidase [Sulfurovum sp. FS08-3]
MNCILKNENAIYYVCGYSNDNCIFLSIEGDSYLFTDGRYAIEAREGISKGEVVIDRDLITQVSEMIKRYQPKSIVFDPKEWSVYDFDKLSKIEGVVFEAQEDFSHKQRIIKTPQEIKLLKRAVTLGLDAFDEFATFVARQGVGMDEYRLKYHAQSILGHQGLYELSFEPIVALAHNTAKPHAMPTEQKLQEGDLLLIDGGVKYHRYCSDRTRVMEVGAKMDLALAQNFSSPKMQRVYDTVLKAHDTAIAGAKSGMKANEIDALARDVIVRAGFGDYFVHGTGHGVGLDIHEMPYITQKSETIIEDGMVFTIEPGIYIPNEFGVRIEDMVVMINGRADIL